MILSLSASGIIAAPLPNEGALETRAEIERETQRAAELTRRHDHAGAEAVYVTLNKRFPRNASILYELGRSRYRQQRYKSAAEALSRAVALVPNDPQSMLVLGAVYHEQERLDEAIEIFRRALALKPGDPVIQR